MTQTPQKDRAAAQAEHRTLSIAVIEDNVDFREMLCALLTLLGHRVIGVVGDGVAGVELLVAQEPDAAFVDIDLPRLDGHSVARSARCAGLGKIHLVAMTGFGQKGDRDRAAASGFDEYVVKPATLERIRRALAPTMASRSGLQRRKAG